MTKVRITALVDRTYHARVHYAKAGTAGGELDVDARPSDAINLGIRFDAPIYVARVVRERLSPQQPHCALVECSTCTCPAPAQPRAWCP